MYYIQYKHYKYIAGEINEDNNRNKPKGSNKDQVLKYNKSYIIFATWPGHYGYYFQKQFITSLPEEIIYKRSFLILKKLGVDMKSDIAMPDPIILYAKT